MNGGAADGPAAAEGKACAGCGKMTESTMSCPTCIKLDLPQAIFCGQECFRESWAKHKKVHKAAERALAVSAAADHAVSAIKDDEVTGGVPWRTDEHMRVFCGYIFSGPLRPWPISPRRQVPTHIERPDYAEKGIPLSEEMARQKPGIEIKTEEQIQRLRESCRLGREALDYAHSLIRPGVTCDEIDEKVHWFIVSRDGYPSPLNYMHFKKSCCTSVNEVICHGVPDTRPLEEGDIVNVDITVFYKGMHGDLNETYFVGKVDKDSHKLVRGAYACLMDAIRLCKPGMMYREVGNVIQRTAARYGLQVVRSYCGHGIGNLFHTAPNVPHYAKNKAVGLMKPGHTFTIEPMINMGTWKDRTWPDDWTAVTVDGKRSAQFEHTLLITETGVQILTARLPTSPPHDFTPDEGVDILGDRIEGGVEMNGGSCQGNSQANNRQPDAWDLDT